MIRKHIISLLIWISAFSIANDCFAFKGDNHNDITTLAIQYLVENENYNSDCDVYPWIVNGSVDEDYPFSEKRWLFHYSPSLSCSLAISYSDAIEWAFEPHQHQALLIPYNFHYLFNEYKWDVAVHNKGEELGWEALGHVVHLLEDMASPAHVRNDPHPGDILLDPDLFEEIGNTLEVPEIRGYLRGISDAREIFRELRDYTQTNFQTTDTMFNDEFEGPIVHHSGIYGDYFYDAYNRKIAYKTWAYRSSLKLGIDNKKLCSIDDTIAEEQFYELAPLAAIYAASLIKYYSDNTGVYPCEQGGGGTFFGSVTDAIGDAGISSVNPSPDLKEASVSISGTQATFVVHFTEGTFSPTSTRAQFLLDLDQNPSTGHPGSDAGGVNDAGIIGSEFLLNLGPRCHDYGAFVYRHTGSVNSFIYVASFPITASANGFTITIPLSAFGGDDGRMNFKVVTSALIDWERCASTAVLDYMPNIGLAAGQVN